jgi:hypothetical protein
MPAFSLYLGKFVVFEFQTVAYINAKGQKGDGYLGNYAGIIVFDESVVTPNVDDGTVHGASL